MTKRLQRGFVGLVLLGLGCIASAKQFVVIPTPPVLSSNGEPKPMLWFCAEAPESSPLPRGARSTTYSLDLSSARIESNGESIQLGSRAHEFIKHELRTSHLGQMWLDVAALRREFPQLVEREFQVRFEPLMGIDGVEARDPSRQAEWASLLASAKDTSAELKAIWESEFEPAMSAVRDLSRADAAQLSLLVLAAYQRVVWTRLPTPETSSWTVLRDWYQSGRQHGVDNARLIAAVEYLAQRVNLPFHQNFDVIARRLRDSAWANAIRVKQKVLDDLKANDALTHARFMWDSGIAKSSDPIGDDVATTFSFLPVSMSTRHLRDVFRR